jgi:hypothetical protein
MMMTFTGDNYEEILTKMSIDASEKSEIGDDANKELYGMIENVLSNAATRIETHKADFQLYA